jgi:hypothetical protein
MGRQLLLYIIQTNVLILEYRVDVSLDILLSMNEEDSTRAAMLHYR